MFPIINNIDDVYREIPYLDTRECFIVSRKENYISINYRIIDSDIFRNAMERECRGLKFDLNGNIIARPFHKFFNENEKEETQTANLLNYDLKAMEKLDGSMIHPVLLDDKIIYMTKAGVTETSELATKFINSSPIKYDEFSRDCIKEGFTPIFEFTSPQNRIVLKYDKPELTLLALRHITTGKYVSRSELITIAENHFIPVVKILPLQSFDPTAEGMEGIVAFCDYSGFRVKMKTNWYTLLHKTKDSLAYEKNMLALFLAEKVDDLISISQDEDKKAIEEWFNYVNNNITNFIDSVEWYITSLNFMFRDNRKNFAIYIQKHFPNKYIQAIYFKLFGKEYSREYLRELVNECLQRNISTENMVDNIRFLIGEKRWQDF